MPACRSLDCVSVFTTDVADAADVLAVLAGPDPADPWSRTAPDRRAGAAPGSLLPADGELDFDGDTAMAAVFAAVAGAAAACRRRRRASRSARCWRPATCSTAGRGWPSGSPGWRRSSTPTPTTCCR